jgi:hypothetical protein
MTQMARRRRAPLLAPLFAMLAAQLAGCVILSDEARRSAGRAATDRSAATPAPVDSAPLALDEQPATAMPLPGVDDPTRAARFTATTLQSELLAFADRYLEAIAEAADRSAEAAADVTERAGFKQTKVVYVTAAITTVTEPEPLRVMRDLLVLLRLQRMVWEDQRHPWAAPGNAARMAQALKILEDQIEKLAALVFDAQDIAGIQSLVQQWHAANPDRRYVAFVRFHDLEDSALKQRFDARLRRGGLLAPVTKAADELEQMRRVAERALFLANHMPMLLEWQAEAYLHGALELPEVQSLTANFDRFTGTTAELSTLVGLLPDQIARERAEALTALAALVRRERMEAIAQLGEVLRAERAALIADVNGSAGQLTPLAAHLAQATGGLRDSLTLLNTWQAGSSDSNFDLARFDTTITGLVQLTGDARTLVEALQGTLAAGDGAAAGVDRLDRLLQAHERRLFGYALAIAVVCGSFLIGTALLLRRRPGA